jgi:ribosomal protein S20
MPIIKSAKKALKQSIKRHSRNENFKDLFKEARKSFEAAIKNNDLEKAKEVFFNTKKDGKTTKS